MSGPHLIHFKLKAPLGQPQQPQWTTITWDGPNHLATIEVKRLIAQHLDLPGKAEGFDFLVTNATTGEEYRDDNFIIHRNTSLWVKRIVGTKERGSALAQKPMIGKIIGDGSNVSSSITTSSGNNGNVSDEQAILNLVQQSSRGARPAPGPASYAPQSYQRQSHGAHAPGSQSQHTPGSKPPPSYVCHRCGQNGHYIRFCPTNGDSAFDGRRPKAAQAVAQYESSNQKFFLKEIDDPKALAQSESPRPAPSNSPPAHAQSQSQSQFDDHSAQPPLSKSQSHSASVPRDLQCPLCGQLYNTPVVLPCCFKSCCRSCLETRLRSSDGHCPLCRAGGIEVQSLRPNSMLNQRVETFRRAAPPPQPQSAHTSQPAPQSQYRSSGPPSTQQSPSHYQQPPPSYAQYQPPASHSQPADQSHYDHSRPPQSQYSQPPPQHYEQSRDPRQGYDSRAHQRPSRWETSRDPRVQPPPSHSVNDIHFDDTHSDKHAGLKRARDDYDYYRTQDDGANGNHSVGLYDSEPRNAKRVATQPQPHSQHGYHAQPHAQSQYGAPPQPHHHPSRPPSVQQPHHYQQQPPSHYQQQPPAHSRHQYPPRY